MQWFLPFEKELGSTISDTEHFFFLRSGRVDIWNEESWHHHNQAMRNWRASGLGFFKRRKPTLFFAYGYGNYST